MKVSIYCRGKWDSPYSPMSKKKNHTIIKRGTRRKKYILSRWGQEVVRILTKSGEMKNVDIMVELNEKGHNTKATHIKEFFKSRDGKLFYKEKLIGNQGYWSLRKSKTVSIPIMITTIMRIELGMLGYSKDDIKSLTPKKANEILFYNIIKSSNRERGKNQ